MAEALLQSKLDAVGFASRVHSAGTLPWRGPASDGARTVMQDRGVDLSDHESRRLSDAMVHKADLILGMTRSHVWTVTTHVPAAADRAFLVAELARLGARVGPRERDESVRDWAARVAAIRTDPRIPGQSQDEVADPAGESVAVYRATANRLDRELARIVALITGA
jgi:protein-tyrosine phosphatase